MEIIINEKLNDVLNKLALSQNMTITQYVEHVINKHLLSHYKQDVLSNVDLDTVSRYKTVIDAEAQKIVDEKLALRNSNLVEGEEIIKGVME